MSGHITKVLAATATHAADLEVVERIAALPASEGGKKRRHISFALEILPFLRRSTRFPIYDKAARDAIRLHLGADACAANNSQPYLAFCQNIDTLRSRANLSCEIKELDRYLWLTGMCMRWMKERGQRNPCVNVELKLILQQPSSPVAGELRMMLPERVAARFRT